jgi:hypothetical protein
MRVRPLSQADIPAAVVLHRGVLPAQFVPQCGLAFLLTYYQAWTEAPGSISISDPNSRNRRIGAGRASSRRS